MSLQRLRNAPRGGPRFPVDNPPGAADAYGSQTNHIEVRTIDLSIERNNDEYPITGDFIWIADATSNAALLNVRPQSQSNGLIPFKKGMLVKGTKFSQLFLTNAAQAGETITLLVAVETNGLFDIVNPTASASQVQISNASMVDTIADTSVSAGATTTIAAASSTRREAIVQSLSSNSAPVRVGPNAAAGRGIELQPGDSVRIPGTDAIACHNPSGSAASIAVLTVED